MHYHHIHHHHKMNPEQQLLDIVKTRGFGRSFPKIGPNASGWPETATDGTPLQFIEDRRNRHKDEEIWILGAGPSLDDFPDDFFDSKEKIAIAVKLARVAFPNCTYYHDSFRGALTQAFIRNNRLHLLQKYIFQLKGGFQPNWPKGYNDKPIYQRVSVDWKNGMASKIMDEKTRGYIYPCLGTVVHYAITAAIVFGAKRISLVGCEHRTINGKKFAQKRGMSFFYKWQEDGKEYYFSKRLLNGTKMLAESFKSHGIEIQRYYYNKGYEAIAS